MVQQKVAGIMNDDSQLVISSESKLEIPRLQKEEEKRITDKDIVNLNKDLTPHKKLVEAVKKGELTEEVIKTADKLTIQVKDGGRVKQGTKIELNAAGCLTSLRKAFDGVTYFGTNEAGGLLVINL
jgi:hypothetical protein